MRRFREKTEIIYSIPAKTTWYYRLFVSFSGFFIFPSSFFFLTFLSLNGFCQPGAEVGVVGGIGYYLGEYNPSSHFKNQQSYIGGFYRYNLNDRFAIRLNAGFSKIEIKDVRLPDYKGEEYPTGFKCSVRDFGGLLEFNFRSFMVPKTNETSFWSPYIFAGVGFLSAGEEGGVSIPVGGGVKFNLIGNLSCGIEWGCRKLFTDKIDGLDDPWKVGESNAIFNKDWFFAGGVTLSYRFPTIPECRGYK